MSVLSDVASKLQQAQSAASNKSKTANYGEALGFIISDMLNSSASDLNPFIRKGAAAQVHFNELDAVEEERERLLGYRDQNEAGGLGGSGFSKGQNGNDSFGMLHGAAALTAALAAKKLIGSILKKFGTRVMGPILAKAGIRTAVAGAASGGLLAPLVGIGSLIWGAGEAVAGLLNILEEEGIDVSGIRNDLKPITDQLDEASRIVTLIGNSEAAEYTKSLVQHNVDTMKATGAAIGGGAYDAWRWATRGGPTELVAATSSAVSETLGISDEPRTVETQQTPGYDVAAAAAAGVPGDPDRARRMQAQYGQTVTANPAPISSNKVSSAARNMATGDFGGMDMDITGIARTVDIEALKELIFGAESGTAKYDAVIGNKTIIDAKGNERKPTDMTVGEIKEWQAAKAAEGWQSTAIGAYQIVGGTMLDSQTTKGISDSAKFTPEVQDKMFKNLLTKRKIHDFESGKISGRQFIFNLSEEWAGLKNMSGSGRYDKQDPITGEWENKGSVSAEALASTFRQTAVPIGGDRPANLPSPHPKEAAGPTPPTKYVPSSPTSQVPQNLNPSSTQTPGSEATNTPAAVPKTQPIILPQALPPTASAPAQSSNHQYQTPSMARIPSVFDMLIASDMMRTV